MKRGFLLCAERVGLIRCFASHPLSGAAMLWRAVSMAAAIVRTHSEGSHPTQKQKATIPDGKIAFCRGEGGIRTHGTIARTTVFETARFNHSRTSPYRCAGLAAQRDCEYKHLGPFVQGFSGESRWLLGGAYIRQSFSGCRRCQLSYSLHVQFECHLGRMN